ncbi:hypothetical protein VPH35_005333 [Triticum aestivum]
MVQPLRRVHLRAAGRALRPVRALPHHDARGAPAAAQRRPAPGRGLHQGPALRVSVAAAAAAARVVRVDACRRSVPPAGQLPARARQEAGAPRRHQLQLHQVRAQRHRQRRQLHGLLARPEVWLPQRLHPRPHAGGEGPEPLADKGQHPAGDAVAGGGLHLRRLPGVPLLRPRRPEAGQQRRRGGRLRRSALPSGLRGSRRDP